MMNEKILAIGEREFKVVPELSSLHNEPKNFRGCFDIYEDETKVGNIAYHHGAWDFHDTDHLNPHEQVELAEGIYYEYTCRLEPVKASDQPEFHPFYMQGMYHGGMESFEILPKEGSFEVAYDGKIIAELSLHNTWKQLSGDPLPKDLFEDIIYQIKKHYESAGEQ